MIREKFDHDNPKSFNQKFRAKRFRFFKSLVDQLPRPIYILDIGGTEIYWQMMNFADEPGVFFTLCNVDPQKITRRNFQFMEADATDLSIFHDKQFDVVYSNSVIEHLFNYERQQKMANEVRRIGKNYFVQTPNLYFPLEPHWLFPFFQFLPSNLRVFITQHFNIGGYKKTNSRELAQKRVDEVKLLSEAQMRALFPDGTCYRERVLGIKKSICMYRF